MINNNSSNFSLYIHFPWCIKKCFYCDFNSYTINKKHHNFEENYLKKLCIDFDYSFDFLLKYQKTNLISIFFGGGTPSLLSGKLIDQILNYINNRTNSDLYENSKYIEEQIDKINRECPSSDMGVYREPTGIPYKIKDPCRSRSG